MASSHVVAADSDNFASAVIERSHERPVLVDFWADWCGPCHSLSPLVEELAGDLEDSLSVVKVDTDTEPELGSRYGIRSLPTLMLFRDGEVVDQMVGAQPLSALEKFVAPYLPKVTDELLESARTALESGDSSAAIQALEEALAIDPGDYRVHPRLVELYLGEARIEDARSLISGLPVDIAADQVVARIASRLNLVDAAAEISAATDEVSQQFVGAVGDAVAGNFDASVDTLLELLPENRDWHGGAIRRALVDIFNVLESDARVNTWRGRMASILN